MNKSFRKGLFILMSGLVLALAFSELTQLGAAASRASRKTSKRGSPGKSKNSENSKSDPAPVKQQMWNKKLGPLVPHKTFPKDCGLCHVPDRWDIIKEDFHFDHEKETGYRLEGAHATAFCVRCHNDRGHVKVYASRGCAGCHVDPHKGSNGPTCTKCHTQFNWQLSNPSFQHSSTRFPLTGLHNALSCTACHPRAESNDFQGAPTDCYSCHKTSYDKAPGHLAMNYPKDCQNCHNTSAWVAGGGFQHSSLPSGGTGQCYTCHQSNFQTAPNHVAQNFSHTCESCHTTNNWTAKGGSGSFDHSTLANGGAGQCYSCHQTNYQTATNHVARNYPQSCEKCHNTISFTGAVFQHSALASGGSGQCYTCHQANFQTAPNHVAQNFSHACESCHNTSSWAPSGGAFNHATLPNGGAGQCYSCHQANYQTAPNHVAQNYSHTCEYCHNPNTSWNSALFNHATLPSGGVGSCYNCHQSDFQGAPNHVSKSYPHSCEDCHNTTSFQGATFVHAFPLSGPHNLSCSTCHANGTQTFNCLASCHGKSNTDGHHQGVNGYSYTSTACYNCHPRGR